MANEEDGFFVSITRDFNGGLALTDRAVRSLYEVGSYWSATDRAVQSLYEVGSYWSATDQAVRSLYEVGSY